MTRMSTGAALPSVSLTAIARVYARAAAGRVGIDRFQEKHWGDLEHRVGAPRVQEVKQPQQQQRTDGSWSAKAVGFIWAHSGIRS